jgi:hypothetical protein
LCNSILKEKYDLKLDVPRNGQNAPTRYNNPGGAYPKQSLERYGLEGYGVIGGGHKIGKYPTPANGVAANIAHLREMLPYIEGKTLGQARHYWHYGNTNGTENLPGMDNTEVITREKLYDQNWLVQWMRSTAQIEGFQKELSNDVFTEAFKILNETPSFSPSGTGDNFKDGGSGKEAKGEKDKEESDNPLIAGLNAKLQDVLKGGFGPDVLSKALNTTLAAAQGAIASTK